MKNCREVRDREDAITSAPEACATPEFLSCIARGDRFQEFAADTVTSTVLVL